MSEESLFTRIIKREIPADIVYEDDFCLAFRDINPQAPVHVLLIPKETIPRIAATEMSHQELLGHLLLQVSKIADQEGIADSGFRTVINNGSDGGETVPHLHIHILGGRPLGWPPG